MIKRPIPQRNLGYFLNPLLLVSILLGATSAHATDPGQLQRGKHGEVSCPVPLAAKMKMSPVKQSPANAKRFIHARGVGEVLIAHHVPKSINQLEGGPFDAAFKKAASSMGHYEAMAQGHFNMSGYPTIKLKSLDLQMTHALDMRILSLSVGIQLRTQKGTGVGSTLSELKSAHGGFSMSTGPEPYHCSVSAQGLPFVSFMYTDCTKACQGERAIKVYIGGAHYDYSAQTWGTPTLYPLPSDYTPPKALSPKD